MIDIDGVFAQREAMISEGFDSGHCSREQNPETGIFEYVAPEGTLFVLSGEFIVDQIDPHPWVNEPPTPSIDRFLSDDEEVAIEITNAARSLNITVEAATMRYVEDNFLEILAVPVVSFACERIGFRLVEDEEREGEYAWEFYAVGEEETEEISRIMPILAPEIMGPVDQELAHGEVNIGDYAREGRGAPLAFPDMPSIVRKDRKIARGVVNSCNFELINKEDVEK